MTLTRDKQKAKEQRIHRDRSNWNKSVWKGESQGQGSGKLQTHEERKSWYESRHK